jgi:hypothetical protein
VRESRMSENTTGHLSEININIIAGLKNAKEALSTAYDNFPSSNVTLVPDEELD